MGSAWVLAARWVVGPEGSSLLTEGLFSWDEESDREPSLLCCTCLCP